MPPRKSLICRPLRLKTQGESGQSASRALAFQEQFTHVAFEDRNRASLPVLRLVGFQCDDAALEFDLRPADVKQLLFADTCYVGAYK
jgi:hypothetical protein